MTTTQPEETWETQEVINWLINDEDCYNALKNRPAWKIYNFVRKDRSAPQGLYESFATPPKSKWSDVNWKEVAEALKEE